LKSFKINNQKMKFTAIITLFLWSCLSAVGQQKITVEEIYAGAFRAKGMDELQAMKNTNQYTVLNSDRATRSQQIDLYDFATLKKVSTLINTKDYKELADGIDSYTFSNDEKQILIANNSNPIFRHSFTADYYLYESI
jgi:dipeptidyl-peptidase-4